MLFQWCYQVDCKGPYVTHYCWSQLIFVIFEFNWNSTTLCNCASINLYLSHLHLKVAFALRCVLINTCKVANSLRYIKDFQKPFSSPWTYVWNVSMWNTDIFVPLWWHCTLAPLGSDSHVLGHVSILEFSAFLSRLGQVVEGVSVKSISTDYICEALNLRLFFYILPPEPR